MFGTDRGNPPDAGRLADLGVELELDGDGTHLLDRVNCVIKSPGVPQDAPVIAAARAQGKTVVGELELGWRMTPNRFVAVTGTNGKTTVAEWLGHVFATAGMPARVAGNVGTPLAALGDDVDPEVTIVCECSSFQLEDSVAFAPEVAVLLNFSPDHLDRHGTPRGLPRREAADLRLPARRRDRDLRRRRAGPARRRPPRCGATAALRDRVLERRLLAPSRGRSDP